MLRNLKLFLIVLLTTCLSALASIDKLYIQSLQKSKQVEIFRLTEKKTLADLKNRTTTLYPTLDILNNNKYENNSVNSFTNEDNIDSKLSLNLEQKLFQGGAEFALSDYKKIIPKQAQALKEKNLSEYYGQFSILYLKVSSIMEENEKVEALFRNLKKRVAIVKKRTKIGRDRKADLYALESQLYRLEANLFNINSQLKSARTDFFNFSGLDSTVEIKDMIDPFKLELTKEVDLEERPDLKNLKFNYESSVLETRMEKSTYYPQIYLSANYFLDQNVMSKNDWDVSLNIRLNLLDFGQRSSSVDIKRVAANINKAQFDFNRLNAEKRWNNFVDSFQSKKRELASLKTALKRSRTSYDEQLKDLSRGLINQIDVIRSLDDVLNLEKLLINSSLEIKTLFYQANAYLGNYPKE